MLCVSNAKCPAQNLASGMCAMKVKTSAHWKFARRRATKRSKRCEMKFATGLSCALVPENLISTSICRLSKESKARANPCATGYASANEMLVCCNS
jgi:hypothetical protein